MMTQSEYKDIQRFIEDLNALKKAYKLVCEELAWCSKKFIGDTTCSSEYYEKLFFEKARERS